MIAIRDHLNLLVNRELEHVVIRESLPITFNLHIQPTCQYPARLCKVTINDVFDAANKQDALLNTTYLPTAFTDTVSRLLSPAFQLLRCIC